MIRRILEAIDEVALREDRAPSVDELGIVTAGTTVTTDVPGQEPEDMSDIDVDELDTEIEEARKRFRDDPAAAKVHGGLTQTSKMPCVSYSMLAGATCPTGSKLSKIPGTVCYGCYAKGGFYTMPSTRKAQALRTRKTRYAMANPDRQQAWIEAVVTSLERSGDDVFRWHDSGDITSAEHLEMLVEVARRMPGVRFWLPTKEHSIVQRWVENNEIPNNLNIRLSAHNMFEAFPARPPLTSSSVESGKGYKCPATWDEKFQEQHNHTCGPCRECWNRKRRNVDYKYHGPQSRYQASRKALGLEA